MVEKDPETGSKANSEASPETIIETVFLGVGTAKPTKKNTEYVPDKNHAVLVFSLARSVDKAMILAKEHFESTGWEDVLIDKMNPVDIDALNKAQPEVINAYELAVKEGSHGMVLNQVNS